MLLCCCVCLLKLVCTAARRSLTGILMSGLSDASKSAARWRLGNFSDGAKQDAIDLMLGAFRPRLDGPSPFRHTIDGPRADGKRERQPQPSEGGIQIPGDAHTPPLDTKQSSLLGFGFVLLLVVAIMALVWNFAFSLRMREFLLTPLSLAAASLPKHPFLSLIGLSDEVQTIASVLGARVVQDNRFWPWFRDWTIAVFVVALPQLLAFGLFYVFFLCSYINNRGHRFTNKPRFRTFAGDAYAHANRNAFVPFATSI